MVNMIASADGATWVDGRTEGLSNPADNAAFAAIRACADWILVGAGTVRAERYGLPRPNNRARQTRQAAGRTQAPRLAVMSSSLALDLDLPILAEREPDEELPLLFTGQDTPDAAVDRLAAVAEVVRLADSHDPTQVLGEINRRGGSVVLCEGGASFNAQLVDADVIDELCLSISPLLAGGPSPRIVHGSKRAVPHQMVLEYLLEDSGTLFARYLRDTKA